MPYSQAVSGQVTATITTTARMSSQGEIGRKRITVASARSRRLLRHITVPSFTTAMAPVAPGGAEQLAPRGAATSNDK
jgi:hypothetical protein